VSNQFEKRHKAPSSAKDLTFQTKISDSIWREHKNTVWISDFVEAIISKMSTIATDKSDMTLKANHTVGRFDLDFVNFSMY
jgi:hypothetical protein